MDHEARNEPHTTQESGGQAVSDVRNSGSGPMSDSLSELYGRGGSTLAGFAGPGDAEEIFDDETPATGPGFLTHAWVHRLVGVLLGLTGLAALAAAIAVAVFRIGDAYLIDHVAGAWMALGDYASQGILYPLPHARTALRGR